VGTSRRDSGLLDLVQCRHVELVGVQPVAQQGLSEPVRFTGNGLAYGDLRRPRAARPTLMAPSGTCPWNRSPVTFMRLGVVMPAPEPLQRPGGCSGSSGRFETRATRI
jgi:hypothetical protein